MNFSREVKILRKKCLLSQEDFAKAIGVSYSTVNRWESGRTSPNYRALKSIDTYCKIHSIEFYINTDDTEDTND